MRAGQGAGIVFGGAAAQAVVTFGLLVTYGTLGLHSENAQWGVWLLLSGGWFVFAAIVAAVITLLPFVGLARRGRLTWWSALVVGVADGAIVTALNAAAGGFIDTGPVWRVLIDMELVNIAGALAGWVAWRRLERKARPDDAAQVF